MIFGKQCAVFVQSVVLLAVGICLAQPGSSQAEERLIRLGMSESGYPPYLMPKGDAFFGIVGDAIKAVAKTINYRVEMIVLPKKRLQEEIKKGHVDAVAGAIEWRHDPADTIWTDSIIQVSDNVVMTRATMPDQAKATSAPRFASQELAGKTIAVMHGYRYPSLEKMIADGTISVTRVHRFSSLLQMVQGNRADYGILDQNVAKWVIRTKKLKFTPALAFAAPGFDEVAFLAILFPTRDWAPFVKEFNKALKQYKSSAAWKALLDEYR